MTSVMPSAMPCHRCDKTLVKTGGITGMCKACRLADPAMAQERRDFHAALKAQVHDFVMKTSDPDPFGRPGIRKVRPGAVEEYFGRATAPRVPFTDDEVFQSRRGKSRKAKPTPDLRPFTDAEMRQSSRRYGPR